MHLNNQMIGTALLDILQKSFTTEVGYMDVAKNSNNGTTKKLLQSKSENRKHFNNKIKKELKILNKNVNSNLNLTRKANDLREDLNDLSNISYKGSISVEEVMRVDRASLHTYTTMLTYNNLPNKLHDLLSKQSQQIKKDIPIISELKKE